MTASLQNNFMYKNTAVALSLVALVASAAAGLCTILGLQPENYPFAPLVGAAIGQVALIITLISTMVAAHRHHQESKVIDERLHLLEAEVASMKQAPSSPQAA